MNWALLKKDLRWSIQRPSLLFLFALVSLYMGLQFFYQLGLFSQMAQKTYALGGTSLLESLWAPYVGQLHLILLLLSPLVVCRAFADERRQDCMLSLLASPLSSAQILWNKFFSHWLLMLGLCLILCCFPLFSVVLLKDIYWPEMLGGFLAIVLLSGFYCSIAIFTSSVFSSYVMAGIFSVVINLSLWSIGSFFRDLIQYERLDWVEDLWVGKALTDLLVGDLSLSAVYFFVATIGFFLFLAYQVLEHVERA